MTELLIAANHPLWFDKSILTAFFCVAAITIAWLRARSPLHPHFILTVAWLVCGPATAFAKLEILKQSDWSIFFNAWFLFIIFYVGTSVPLIPASKVKNPLRKPIRRSNPHRHRTTIRQSGKLDLYIQVGIAVGTCMVAAEFLRQLSSCGFSLSEWLEHSLSSRYDRPWAIQTKYGGVGVIGRVWSLLFPMSGMCLGASAPFSKGVQKQVGLIGLLGFLTIAFFSGSRTPFVMPIVCLIAGRFYRRGFGFDFGTFAAICVAILSIVASNVMVNTRAKGISGTRDYSFLYDMTVHTDDSFQRLMRTLCIDEEAEEEHLAATPFLLTAGFNFVPRAIWTSKPTFTQKYFGRWRVFYTTVTAPGEFVCMFGFFTATILCFFLGQLLQSLMNFSSAYCQSAWGFAGYMYSGFFCYMIFRSLFNFGVFMLPFAVMTTLQYRFATKQKHASRVSKLCARA